MQMLRLTPSKNAQSRARARPMQVQAAIAPKTCFDVAETELPRIIYLQPDRSKVAKQIPYKLQERPPPGPCKTWEIPAFHDRKDANVL